VGNDHVDIRDMPLLDHGSFMLDVTFLFEDEGLL